jgi:hypothetical protein
VISYKLILNKILIEFYLIIHITLERTSENINKQNQGRLSEIVDRLSSQPPPGPVGTVNLPTVYITIFNGNYLEWTSFHDLFVSLIHSNEKLTTSQKLH